MALSAAGSSGSRRQNSAYSPTGIGDIFLVRTRISRIIAGVQDQF